MADNHHSRYRNVDPLSVIRLASEQRSLLIVWRDQAERALMAQFLRSKCRSSVSIRARIEGSSVSIFSDLMIERIELVGSSSSNVSFSDAEDRGIYPWALLLALAKEHPSAKSN